MPVERLRVVTDRWEWDALAQLAPTIYHEHSWTLSSVTRVKAQTSLPVTFGYARVWVGDETMVGCPLMRMGEQPWYNSPRAAPVVLVGTNLNAAGAVVRAIARNPRGCTKVVLHDDSELVDAIDRARMSIEVRSSHARTYRAMSGREIDQVVDTLAWAKRARAREWGEALRSTFNSGSWSTHVDVHTGDDANLVGYLVWVTRKDRPAECIAAALVGARTPAWTVSR